jgi:hypothetical protein
MRTVVAIDAHEIPRRAPVRVVAGDEVTASERDAQWPAFVFVTATQGAGSVPARQLSADAGPATVLTPYDTTELPTPSAMRSPYSADSHPPEGSPIAGEPPSQSASAHPVFTRPVPRVRPAGRRRLRRQ